MTGLSIEEFVTDCRHVLRVDIPGVNPRRDLDLTVEGEVLRLRGQRRAEKHDQCRTEIRYGSFERIVTLPPGTRPEDVEAEYVDGVLTVSMPVGSPDELPESQDGARRVPVAHWSLGDN